MPPMNARRHRSRTILPLAISLALHGAAFAACLDWRRPALVGATDSSIPVFLVIELPSGNSDTPGDGVSGAPVAEAAASIPIVSSEGMAPAPIAEPTTAASPPVAHSAIETERPQRRAAPQPPRTPPPKASVTNSRRRGVAPSPNPIADTASAPRASGEVTNAASTGAEGHPETVAPSGASLSADSDYLAAIMAALARHKHYPDRARLRGEQGTVLVAFAVDRSGRILSFDVRRGSGSAALDEAAEAMVRGTEPLPPAPPNIPGARFEIILPVSFNLR